MSTRDPGDTKARLLAAEGDLFAERGFHGTKARDIAERAGVNLAASNYHYGSKRELYLEVLRAQFAAIRSRLERQGAARPAGGLARMSRAELAELLRTRCQVMFDLLIGPPPGLHGTLMQREMTDPSEALPVIVEEFITPMLDEMKDIIAGLAPGLSPKQIERCAISIMGQIVFYRFSRAATLLLWGLDEYPRGLARELAEHVTEFSLGGLERLTRQKQRTRHAR